MEPKKTSAYLALLRKSRGWTQQELADRLGVSNKTVSKWESGGGFPEISVLPALAEIYGVTADEILAGEPRTSSPPAGAPSQVEQYLSRRGDLRFRLGLAAAAVLWAAAAWLYLGSRVGLLLLLGSFLALWAGFAACSPQILGKRLRLLLPLAAAQTWLAARYLWSELLAPVFHVSRRLPQENYFFIWGTLQELAAWTGALLLIPLVYAALRGILRRQGGGTLLLRREFGVCAAGWGAMLCWAGARWLWEWPLAMACASVDPYHERTLERARSAYWSIAEPFTWLKWCILLGVVLTLALLCLRKK